MAGQTLHEKNWKRDERIGFCLGLTPIAVLWMGAMAGVMSRPAWPGVEHVGYFMIAVLSPQMLLWWVIWRTSHCPRWCHWVLGGFLVIYWMGFIFQWSFIMPYALLNKLSMGQMIRKGIQR